jgi:hypothetical protein
VILWRVLPWQPRARPEEAGGALWFPRELQGAGRHDNPDLYGCMYVGESALSPVVEALAPFRGTGSLADGMLTRAGVALGLATLSLRDGERIVDLDDPRVLLDVDLRPSLVASTARAQTQTYAARLHSRRPAPAALRWWSTIEASLINLTLFDRARPALAAIDVEPLKLEHPVVREAAALLGLE